LLYGEPSQFLASMVGIAVNVVWVASAAAATLWAVDRVVGNRVSTEAELQGLDVPELGAPGYMDAAGEAQPEPSIAAAHSMPRTA
jgi:Amt family ammonium transporter